MNMKEMKKDLSELKEQIKNEKEKGKFYEEENNALSKQVGNLLKENNDLKKGKDKSTLNLSITPQETNVPIISSEYITFNDIEDLQKKNRQLLNRTRELEKEKEIEKEQLKRNLTIEFTKKV